MTIEHLVNAPGRNIKCSCGEPASVFVRCRVAKCRLSWCGNCAPKRTDVARLEHERTHEPRRQRPPGTYEM